MDERLRFVSRLLEGEAMTDVCREFGISRKTGYKIYQRYQKLGLEALSDRSRRPVRYANQLPPQIEGLIVSLKRQKPHWGARKIRELLVRRLDGDIRIPAKSTVHAVLHRHGGQLHAGAGRGAAHDQAAGKARIDAQALAQHEVVLGGFRRGGAGQCHEPVDFALVDAGIVERVEQSFRRQRDRRLIRQLALPRLPDAADRSLAPRHCYFP